MTILAAQTCAGALATALTAGPLTGLTAGHTTLNPCIGPVFAVPKLLKRAGVRVSDMSRPFLGEPRAAPRRNKRRWKRA